MLPAPEMKTILRTTLPTSLSTFWSLFMGDAAADGMIKDHHHAISGNTEIAIAPWSVLTTSAGIGGGGGGGGGRTCTQRMERVQNFRSLITGSASVLMKSTRVRKDEVCSRYAPSMDPQQGEGGAQDRGRDANTDVVVVDASCSLLDAPYGSHFNVTERVVMQVVPGDTDAATAASLDVHVLARVVFTDKAHWLTPKTLICANAYRDITGGYDKWLARVQSTLAALVPAGTEPRPAPLARVRGGGSGSGSEATRAANCAVRGGGGRGEGRGQAPDAAVRTDETDPLHPTPVRLVAASAEAAAAARAKFRVPFGDTTRGESDPFNGATSSVTIRLSCLSLVLSIPALTTTLVSTSLPPLPVKALCLALAILANLAAWACFVLSAAPPPPPLALLPASSPAFPCPPRSLPVPTPCLPVPSGAFLDRRQQSTITKANKRREIRWQAVAGDAASDLTVLPS